MDRSFSLRIVLLALVLPMTAAPAFGQGFLLDRRHHEPISGTYDIREVSLKARIRDQSAEVLVSQSLSGNFFRYFPVLERRLSQRVGF